MQLKHILKWHRSVLFTEHSYQMQSIHNILLMPTDPLPQNSKMNLSTSVVDTHMMYEQQLFQLLLRIEAMSIFHFVLHLVTWYNVVH